MRLVLQTANVVSDAKNCLYPNRVEAGDAAELQEAIKKDHVCGEYMLFEFSGDKKKIRHCMYYCTATRPTIEGKTNEDSKEVQTESLEITATPLPSGLVKVKTGANTTDEVYNGWYSAVYQSPTTEPTEQGQG